MTIASIYQEDRNVTHLCFQKQCTYYIYLTIILISECHWVWPKPNQKKKSHKKTEKHINLLA